jgi:hypothetical protein
MAASAAAAAAAAVAGPAAAFLLTFHTMRRNRLPTEGPVFASEADEL